VRTASPIDHDPASEVPSAGASGRRLRGAAVAVVVLGRVGSLVTLGALLVLAATAAGLADGVPAGGAPTMTVTYER
jgi:hypothetical protein